MDWFRSCCELTAERPVFITDNYGKEGFTPLLRESDDVRELVVIDPVLPDRPSVLGHRWRNLIKLALIPLQVFKLRRALRALPRPFVFAHSTYYAFIASFCNVPYSATPQGSEVLVRPGASRFYRYMLARSVRKAAFVTVDSTAMADKLQRVAAVVPHIVQNGIDMRKIASAAAPSDRTLVMSIRGISDNYRIDEIIRGRNQSAPSVALNFSFPFVEEGYARQIREALGPNDVMHKELSREQLYTLFKQSICVVSIPKSDSSPRSVYEAIFCGAVAVCASAAYVDSLPPSMRSRIVLADPADPSWFATAYARATEIVAEPFQPCANALEQFDQLFSMKKCLVLAEAKASASISDGTR
jgi:hypothetical protein